MQRTPGCISTRYIDTQAKILYIEGGFIEPEVIAIVCLYMMLQNTRINSSHLLVHLCTIKLMVQ